MHVDLNDSKNHSFYGDLKRRQLYFGKFYNGLMTSVEARVESSLVIAIYYVNVGIGKW